LGEDIVMARIEHIEVVQPSEESRDELSAKAFVKALLGN